jgi:hypothetical protein
VSCRKQRDWSLARGVVNTKGQLQRHSQRSMSQTSKPKCSEGLARHGQAQLAASSRPGAAASHQCHVPRYLVTLVYLESDPPQQTATARELLLGERCDLHAPSAEC